MTRRPWGRLAAPMLLAALVASLLVVAPTAPPAAASSTGPAQAISAGQHHVCAIVGSGEVRCWGQNDFGQLGNGTTTNSSTPVSVLGITNAVSIDAGLAHTCAALATGTVMCWGGDVGQLGTGLPPLDGFGFVSTTPTPTPVTASGISDAIAVATGLNHTCALVAGGAVRCWGQNNLGELGNGTTTTSMTPVTVSDVVGAVAIAAGTSHTCAAMGDGSVRCWGANQSRQLGDLATTSAFASTPVTATGIGSAVSVNALGSHTCAALSGGALACWGDNDGGELGNGTVSNNSSLPVFVSGVTDASAVAAGLGSTCAVVAGGAVRCWGFNFVGQLGNGTTTASSVPVATSGITSAVAVAVGNGFACAVVGGGSVKCWGRNFAGQLGDGTTTSSLIPVTVLGIPTALPPVIFMPGVLGSEIWCNSVAAIPLWPAFPAAAVSMELEADGQTNASTVLCPTAGPRDAEYDDDHRLLPGKSGIAESLLGADIYGEALGELAEIVGHENFYAFGWDWRKDTSASIARLDALVDQAIEETGADQVQFIAHSYGGLLAVDYASDPTRRAKLARVMTVGTPYLGAAKSPFSLLTGTETAFIPSGFVEGLATMQSIFGGQERLRSFARNLRGMFNLWPAASYGSFLTVQGRDPQPLDAAGIADLITDLGGSASAWQAAQAKHDTLWDRLDIGNLPWHMMVVGGRPTIRRITVFPESGSEPLRVGVTLAPGDGTVPLRSQTLLATDETTAVNLGVIGGTHPNLGLSELCFTEHSKQMADPDLYSRIDEWLLSGTPPDENLNLPCRADKAVVVETMDASFSEAISSSEQVVPASRRGFRNGGPVSVEAAENAGLVQVLRLGRRGLILVPATSSVALSISPAPGRTLQVTTTLVEGEARTSIGSPVVTTGPVSVATTTGGGATTVATGGSSTGGSTGPGSGPSADSRPSTTPATNPDRPAAAPTTAAIRNTSRPTVTGEPQVGAVLRASAGQWSQPGVTIAYQWLRAGRAVPEADGPRYRVTAADAGRRLSVRVTATLSDFTAGTATSAATAAITRPSTVSVAAVRSGRNATVTVTVRSTGLTAAQLTGTVAVRSGDRRIAVARLSGGEAVLRLTQQPPRLGPTRSPTRGTRGLRPTPLE